MDNKIILSMDVTFDEASTVKPTDSQQVESEKTNKISQQVEGDTTPSPDRSIIIRDYTWRDIGGDHVANKDVNNEKDQGQVVDDVQLAHYKHDSGLCSSGYWEGDPIYI